MESIGETRELTWRSAQLFIDLHSHLDLLDIEKAIDNAMKKNVVIVMGSGISPESNRKILSFSRKYDVVKASVGLYPIDAMATESGKDYSPDVDAEIEFLKKHKDEISFIGEIGLDYKTGTDKDSQKKLFRQMLGTAKELGKPVIIHSRRAEADVLEILAEFDGKVILHCFSGRKNLVRQAIDKGYSFTIPTCIVRSQQFQYMADVVPLRQIFCETDSPFLSPYKDKPNEPAFVVRAYQEIARIKGLDVNEIAKIVFSNWQRVTPE